MLKPATLECVIAVRAGELSRLPPAKVDRRRWDRSCFEFDNVGDLVAVNTKMQKILTHPKHARYTASITVSKSAVMYTSRWNTISRLVLMCGDVLEKEPSSKIEYLFVRDEAIVWPCAFSVKPTHGNVIHIAASSTYMELGRLVHYNLPRYGILPAYDITPSRDLCLEITVTSSSDT